MKSVHREDDDKIMTSMEIEKAPSHDQLVSTSIQTHDENIMKAGVYDTSLSVKEQVLVTSLLGKTCVVSSKVNDTPSTVVLDTGACTSLFVRFQFPPYKLSSCTSLINRKHLREQ